MAAVKTRLDRVEKRVDKIDDRLGHVETGLRTLRTDMPKIVADTMREVLQEQRHRTCLELIDEGRYAGKPR